MSACLWFRARHALTVLMLVLLTTACGGGGGGGERGDAGDAPVETEPESDLPAPPEGKATIGGVLTVNGEPMAGEDVSLVAGTADEGAGATGGTGPGPTGPTGPASKTAADGSFLFEGVDPGSYAVSVGVLVEDAFSSDSFGLSWDDPCHADGFQSLNAAVADDATGDALGVIVAASNQVTSTNADQVTPIEAAAGDRITVDIPLVCRIGGGTGSS